MAAQIPILAYHRLAEPNAGAPYAHLCVSPSLFQRHLAYLQKRLMPAPASDLAQAVVNEERGKFLITFDDGFAELASCAEIFAAVAPGVAVFLVTDLMGEPARWLSRDGYEPPRLLTWDEARQLSAAGITFGSHTLTHPRLSHLERQEQRRQLRESKAKIEDRLGKETTLLAYPFGDYNPQIADLAAEAGYAAALTMRRGSWHLPQQLHRLRRVPAHEGVRGWRFAYRLSWWYGAKYAILEHLRRSRYL
ncbi:MAG: polysaccharide deacetylase family protein [Planctomycetota bacterium]|nr:polysaccharide deacetylase family protein [Planctomycetota bacterium]